MLYLDGTRTSSEGPVLATIEVDKFGRPDPLSIWVYYLLHNCILSKLTHARIFSQRHAKWMSNLVKNYTPLLLIRLFSKGLEEFLIDVLLERMKEFVGDNNWRPSKGLP